MTALAKAPTLFDDLGAQPTTFPGRDGGRKTEPARFAGRDTERTATIERRSEPTLDDVIAGAWSGLIAHQAVACLACGESMTPEYGAHALPIGGRCDHCGTTLR